MAAGSAARAALLASHIGFAVWSTFSPSRQPPVGCTAGQPTPNLSSHTHTAPVGDHLVGWANSSLRRLDQLPALPALAASARGVVLEDPLGASLAPSVRGVSRGNSEDHGSQGGSPLGAALRKDDQRGAAALQGSSEDSQGASLLQASSGGAHVPPAQASRGCSEGSRQDMQGLGNGGAASGPHSSSGRATGGALVKNISGPSGPLGALRFSSSASGAAGAQRRDDAAGALAGAGADGGWSGGWSSGALIQRGLELMQNAQVSGAGLAERLSTRWLHRSHCCACLLCLLALLAP